MSRHTDHSNPKRLRILSLVRRTPSISHRELADITGLSVTGVHHHLVSLEKEGVITRSHEVGRHNNYYKPYRNAVKKTRKQVSSVQLTEYAKQGRGTNAFVPRKTKKRDILQERIDRVVAKALGSQTNPQHDVIRHVNAPLRLTNSHKVG